MRSFCPPNHEIHDSIGRHGISVGDHVLWVGMKNKWFQKALATDATAVRKHQEGLHVCALQLRDASNICDSLKDSERLV